MRLSATGSFVPSSAVRVRVQVPSSVQVTLVTAAAALAKVQLAPASVPVPRAVHRRVGLSSGSVAEPDRATLEPSVPVSSAPASTTGGSLMGKTVIVTVAWAVPPRPSVIVYVKVSCPK